MVTPTQSFPRCTADLRISNMYHVNDISLHGTCSSVFSFLRVMEKEKVELLEGKVSIQFVPEKKEVYTLEKGAVVENFFDLNRLIGNPEATQLSRKYVSIRSIISAFENVLIYMKNDAAGRILIPLSLRGLTIDNLAIRRQDDEKA
jgi:hypothetical protein